MMRQSHRRGGDSTAGRLSLVSLPGYGERVYEWLPTLAVSNLSMRVVQGAC